MNSINMGISLVVVSFFIIIIWGMYETKKVLHEDIVLSNPATLCNRVLGTIGTIRIYKCPLKNKTLTCAIYEDTINCNWEKYNAL